MPTVSPFLNHSYVGDPPFVGLGVNVTDTPSQMSFSDADTETLAANSGFTVMVTTLEVAGLPVLHVRLDVMTT